VGCHRESPARRGRGLITISRSTSVNVHFLWCFFHS
jgi:hypothetical protein